MGTPEGFTWVQRSDGRVVISHQGRRATVLRGRRALDFVDDARAGDDQELMARVTGNYRHGNERTAKNHPRHR